MASFAFYSGNTPDALPCLESSGQSFKRGDAIKFTSGLAVISTDGATQGYAGQDASGTASTQLVYYPFGYDNIYLAYNSTTTAATDVGSFFQIRDFTAGAMTVTASTNGQSEFLCVALDPRDAVGTSGGRVLLRFLPPAVAAT
jgi:hypothetical protein